MSKQVLIMAHEFPPSAGGGVQRIAKFARYLPSAGWTPFVVAGEVDAARPADDTLLEGLSEVEVMRVPAVDVRGAVARALSHLKRRRRGPAEPRAAEATSAQERRVPLSTRIAAWVSVPDRASFWITPAVRAGVALGRRHEVAAVFASGPPHSVLVAGARVASALGVPFVADMRDAWRDNPSIHYPTALHRARAEDLERRVMRSAATVTCVSEPIAAEARQMGAREAIALPNGFDPEDLPAWAPAPGDLRLAFMGTMYRPLTDPAPLLEAMKLAVGLSVAAARVSLDVIGSELPWVLDEVDGLGLRDRVRFLGYRPHAEALDLLARADVGVVLISDATGSEAVYTGKIFEYLGMGIPVLLVGPPDGVAADLVREAQAGVVVRYSDVPACAAALVALEDRKQRGEAPATPDAEVVARYDRRRQASVLAELLDRVTGAPDL